jgi:hypothetical protein
MRISPLMVWLVCLTDAVNGALNVLFPGQRAVADSHWLAVSRFAHSSPD